ncbi:MAG: sodium:alanine symporter family protein [Myxococcales bacterium]|nr:sodium:alanine symporter family protein [Myxococcales bacterium]
MEQLEKVLSSIGDFIWGVPMIVLLFGTHLFLTVRLRFIQRYLGKAIRLSFSRGPEGKGDVSHFGALMTALAATIGTGNIVGVATAIGFGGPGAVLWMWLTGVFGIATKYAEAVLAVKYRVQNSRGEMAGGPMYALERGLGQRWLGVLFAVFTAIAAFGIGNMVQAHSVSDMLSQEVSLPPVACGAVLAVLTGVVILGGIRWIARACAWLVPIMAVGYLLCCLVLLASDLSAIPRALELIVTSAFSGQAAIGGFAGAGVKEAVRFGIARGLFSNESGLGSAPIVAAAAQTKNPVRQALVSSTGTFWDTVVVCLVTGLVLVSSGEWEKGLAGAELTRAAFVHLHFLGPLGLTFALLTFVFSTILGWEYYGEKAAEYLFGVRAILPYRLLWVAAVFVGSLGTLKAVWAFADIANAFMALPNLVALLLLSGVVVHETKKYLWEGGLDRGEDDPLDGSKTVR